MNIQKSNEIIERLCPKNVVENQELAVILVSKIVKISLDTRLDARGRLCSGPVDPQVKGKK